MASAWEGEGEIRYLSHRIVFFFPHLRFLAAEEGVALEFLVLVVT